MVTEMEVRPADELMPAESVAPVQVQRETSSAQIDTIIKLADYAKRYPRNEDRALQKTLAAADDSSVWQIPNRGEGLSVNIARTALRHYRNSAVIPNLHETTMQVEGRDGAMKYVPAYHLQVLAVDMENMVVEMSTALIERPRRNPGEKDLAYTQRCFQQSLAFLGRLERNAIFKIIPGEWRDQIMQVAKAKTSRSPLEQRIKQLLADCEGIGIGPRILERIIGCKPQIMSEAQYADLRGRYNAVRNAEATVLEAFSTAEELAEAKAAAEEHERGEEPAPARWLDVAKGLGFSAAQVREKLGKDPKDATRKEADELLLTLQGEAQERIKQQQQAKKAANGEAKSGAEDMFAK